MTGIDYAFYVTSRLVAAVLLLISLSFAVHFCNMYSEGGSQPPRLLGEIRGTPTIRLFKPKKKQRQQGSHALKDVLDYNGERMAKNMREFIEYSMPDYTDKITFGQDDHTKIIDKATKYGLPRAMLFLSKAKTTSTLKYLSTVFRRRLLVVTIPPTKKNANLMSEYGLSSTEDLPALIVVQPDGTQIKYEESDFKARKLERFLSQYANKEPVYKPIAEQEEEKAEEPDEAEKEQPDPKVKVEL